MSCQLSNLKTKKKVFAAGIDVRIVPSFLKLLTFFWLLWRAQVFSAVLRMLVFFSFLGADKAFWLSQILCLFPIVTVLCGWLVVIHMKQPRVFPEDKIQHYEECKCQSKLIGGRGWICCAFLTCASVQKCGFFGQRSAYNRQENVLSSYFPPLLCIWNPSFDPSSYEQVLPTWRARARSGASSGLLPERLPSAHECQLCFEVLRGV